MGLLRLLRDRPGFLRLWSSDLVSLLGDWLSFVAVSVLALGSGQGALALAWVLVAHMLPHALLAPVAGTLADRFDRRRLLVAANLVEGLVTLGMAAAAAGGAFGAVQVLVLVRASVAAVRAPAASAALRRLVEPAELTSANTLLSATWSVMFAVGMGAGGALAALGPAVALLLDASSFGVAALLLSGLPRMQPEVDAFAGERGAAPLCAASVHRDMLAAWRRATAEPALLRAVLAKTPFALAGGGAWVLLNRTAVEATFAGSAAVTLGLLQCVRGAGTGLGPLAMTSALRRGASHALVDRALAVTALVGIAMLALASHPLLLLAAALLWGAGVGSNWVASSAEIQRRAPDRFTGRLAAIDLLACTAAMCLAALAGAWLVEVTGVATWAAWLGLAAAIPAWLGLRRLSRSRPTAAELSASAAAW